MLFKTVLICLSMLNGAFTERLHEQIYSSIEGGAACFRRLNGTHQMGCSSSDKGAVGVVQMIRDISDAQWLVLNATAGPYVAVVSTSLFNRVIEQLVRHPEVINGILLYDNATDKATSFSQESKCPNEYSSEPDSQCPSAGGVVWNDGGTGLLRRDIPFPIFYIPESKTKEMEKIEKCYERFNTDKNNQKGKPLCSLQLHSFMYAAVNSVVCMRRSASSTLLTSTKVCDPLTDYNVYYSLFPLKKKNETEEKKILVTARIDTASLFDGISPGAASSVVGMVTLITAARALSEMINVNESYANNVLWTLFNGEAFDYIGSQRVAYDISREAWPPAAPVTPSDIALHVELGQIGGALRETEGGPWPLYAVVPNLSLSSKDKVQEFLTQFSSYVNKSELILPANWTSNLPPSSLHSFRRILKNSTSSGDIPQLLLVDHKETFTNKFYESVLDNYTNINYVYHNISIGINGSFFTTDFLISNGTMSPREPQVRVARLATSLARALYQQVKGIPYSGTVAASAHMVDEMMYCFLKSQACNLLVAADYMPPGASSPDIAVGDIGPALLYVNVPAWNGSASTFAGHLLALLTGNHRYINRTECDKLTKEQQEYSYYYLKGWNLTGVCIETTMNFSQALSPAFTIPNYDMTSGEYSTWTESVWQTFWVRLFVAGVGQGARVAAVCGAIATALAAFFTFWLHAHSSTIFVNTRPPLVSNDASTGILRTVNC